MSNPLNKRFDYLVGLLAKADEKGNEEKAEGLLAKLSGIISDAKSEGVELAISDELEERLSKTTTEQPAPAKAGKKTKKAATKKKVAKTPAKQPTPCECGCGELVPRRFAQGHDARLHSMILKAKRGLMLFKDLPKLVQKARPELEEENEEALAAIEEKLAAKEQARQERAEAKKTKKKAAAKKTAKAATKKK